jgi:hypothetical protein
MGEWENGRRGDGEICKELLPEQAAVRRLN